MTYETYRQNGADMGLGQVTVTMPTLHVHVQVKVQVHVHQWLLWPQLVMQRFTLFVSSLAWSLKNGLYSYKV